MKTALIIGCNGQDGKITRELLSQRGYGLVCIDKDYVGTHGVTFNKKTDIEDFAAVVDLVRAIKFDEIYFFAAYHNSSQEKEKDKQTLFKRSYAINVYSLFNFLEAIRLHSLTTRLFYAASSLIFADTEDAIQNEETSFKPNCIYGITKINGLMLCRLYRSKYGVFAATGILYNHESEYRTEDFLSKKIIKTAVDIKKGLKTSLTIGDLNAEVDWGYAYDYVDAFTKIMSIDEADDFIIATGVKHKVLDFVKTAFNYLSLDWSKYVQEDKSIIHRKRKALVGDYSKLNKRTGWAPTTTFEQMIKSLIEKEGKNSDGSK
ncbi:MAG: GDP-mannose 4,6-dehydratase [bacterium]